MVNKEGKVLKPEQLEELQKIISSVKYGSVTLIIQDGVLLQIEKNEKIKIIVINNKLKILRTYSIKINIIMNKVISDWKTRGHTSKT